MVKMLYVWSSAVSTTIGKLLHPRRWARARKMGRSFLRPMIIVGRIIIQQPAAAAALWF
jgi:hypothetical protein